MTIELEALVVGAGAAGLRAALELAERGVSCAVLSKTHPTRAPTVAAREGIAAALGAREEDRLEWHLFDTVRGGDYLVDQAAAEVVIGEATELVRELERLGVPFARSPAGGLDQRILGGHTRDLGAAALARACWAGDATGSHLGGTLYGACLRRGVRFFDEQVVLDLLFDRSGSAGKDPVAGVVALRLADGQIETVRSKAVLLATGGYGRLFEPSSNAFGSTGDGAALCWRSGLPLQDVEFFQFHPTGLAPGGTVLSEAARGEGGRLLNGSGERFLARWAPAFMELAPADLVCRAMQVEIREGRGVAGRDRLHLDLRHLGKALDERLPDVLFLARTFAGVDPHQEPIAVRPTAHTSLGGIPTTVDGQVLADEHGTQVPGLFAAGECASTGVHGATRLAGNGLAEALVLGRRAGRAMAEFVRRAALPGLARGAADPARAAVERLRSRVDGERGPALGAELRVLMSERVGILRDGPLLEEAQRGLREISSRYERVRVADRGRVFNTDLVETIELGHLIDCGEATIAAAIARRETRGTHVREDFPTRDDGSPLAHSLTSRSDRGPVIRYRPIGAGPLRPAARAY